MMISRKKTGFTLIELLLVAAILIILASISIGYWTNISKNIELDSAYRMITYDLKNTQAKAMSGENNLKWGIHFVSGSADYYEIFSTATNYAGKTAVDQTVYLPGNVDFTAPADGTTYDVIFNRIVGAASETTITISSNGGTKNISVNSIGKID